MYKRQSYNRIAGQSVERLAALSDGVFAVAMTLLTYGWRWRARAAARHVRHDFHDAGIFWVGQQTQLNHLTRSDRSLSWMHILFLFKRRSSLDRRSILSAFCSAW